MNKKQVLEKQKSVLIGVVVLAVATIAGLAVVATVASQQAKLAPDTQASVVNLSGKTVCLPKKDTSGPQTTECAYGLEVADDVHYALADLGSNDAADVRTGYKVTVTGTLSSPPEKSIYDTAGVINVDEITLQK